MPESKRVADRYDEIADTRLRRIANRHFFQSLDVDLDNSDVRRRIGANDLGIVDGTVDQRYLDRVCAADDMMVGQDIAAFGIDDDSGSGAGNFARAAVSAVRQAEKASERIVSE
jgi:hypothetical protein